jgi:hypothetical protein
MKFNLGQQYSLKFNLGQQYSLTRGTSCMLFRGRDESRLGSKNVRDNCKRRCAAQLKKQLPVSVLRMVYSVVVADYGHATKLSTAGHMNRVI